MPTGEATGLHGSDPGFVYAEQLLKESDLPLNQ
jgi:hypothetical protein